MPSSAGPSEQPTASEKFYGLLTRPFSLTPDLRFAYHSRSHTHALEQVTEALRRREGLIVVTGEIGTGKTMLCRTLLETFEARTFLSVVLDPCLNVEDLLRQVLTDFGLVTEGHSATGALTEVTRHQLVTTLQRFLASLISIDAHAVIMIDEAQHLNPGVLEEIRLLSNFETDNAKLLQIVLVGQPDLDELLKRPDMRQLDQRIARRFQLHPLSDNEVQDYIDRRLFVAAGGRPASDQKPVPGSEEDPSTRRPLVEFDPTGVAAVAAISGGIPRVVNTLCDRALEVGFEQQTRTIDRATVLAAAARLKLAVPARLRIKPGMLIPAAAVLLLAIGGLALFMLTGRTRPVAAPSARTAPAASEPSAPAAAVAAPADPRPAQTSPLPPSPAAQRPAGTGAPSEAATATSGAASAVAPQASAPRPSADVRTGGRFTIMVAAFKTPGRANAVAAEIAAQGLPVTSRIDPTGMWYQIIVGPYASVGEAEAAQVILERDGFEGTRIFPRPSDTR